MADLQSTDGERKARRRRRKSYDSVRGEKSDALGGNGWRDGDLGLYHVQAIDIDRVRGSTVTRKSAANSPTTSNMSLDFNAPTQNTDSGSAHRRRRKHHGSSEESRHRRSESSSRRPESAGVAVYEVPITRLKSTRVVSQGRQHREARSRSPTSSDEERSQVESVRERPRESRRRDVVKNDTPSRYYPPRVEYRERPSLQRSHSYTPRRPSVPDPPPAVSHQRSPSISSQRSESWSGIKRSHTAPSTPVKSPSCAPSATGTSSSHRSHKVLGGFFGMPAQTSKMPEKMIECLTCGEDEVPRSKSAKLKCGHRMCNSCLKRVFRMSTTDPHLMPPKCCTEDHISLKHVERLFDNNFKRLWNRKFQEFTTKNRLYCPAARCGEWIKPANIHRDSDGKKYGKCSRCSTKVCCECNTKWHGSKDCPKDEETKRLLKQAKESGWQRCYSCRTMVELKEGCNHMTCRCKAQFCMCCGAKWKTCDCPWFNYDTIETINITATPGGNGRQPLNYHAELLRRRVQERDDEILARQLQASNLRDAQATPEPYGGNIGQVYGLGNSTRHFMNENYVQQVHQAFTQRSEDRANSQGIYTPELNRRRSTGPPPPAPLPPPIIPVNTTPLPPPLRRNWGSVAGYNAAQRNKNERIVPARERSDYRSEAAVHAPLRTFGSVRRSRKEPTASDLAGLPGRGSGRVDQWRTHVTPVEPPEGVLSI